MFRGVAWPGVGTWRTGFRASLSSDSPGREAQGRAGGAVGKKGVGGKQGFRAGKVISSPDEVEVRPGSPRAAGERRKAGILR